MHVNSVLIFLNSGCTGLIGNSFSKPKPASSENNFEMPTITSKLLKEDDRKVFDSNAPEFRKSKYCYDTPGVVHPDQVNSE